MFCQFCGTTMAAEQRFCTQCGRMQAIPQGPQAAMSSAPGTIYVPKREVRSATGRWIGEGWDLVKSDIWLFALITLLYIVLSGAVPLVLQGPLMLGFYLVFAKRLRGMRSDLNDFFRGLHYFVPALVAHILITVFVTIGTVLLIIPGLILAAMFQFTMLFILDKRMDFWPAMQSSRAVVRNDYFGFTMFTLTLILLNVLGALLCGVGLLFTIPVSMAAVAVAYRDCVGFDPAAEY